MKDLLDIKLSNFEGPLDLLLHLIYKNELDLYDIPISLIADQFIESIKGIDEVDMEAAADFIQMASYLIYLKSKMLLPHQVALDEGVDPEEEKFLFTQRLIEYSFYKDVANYLKEKEFFSQRYIVRNSEIHLPIEGLKGDLYKLASSFYKLIDREKEKIVTIKKDTIDLEETVENLREFFKDEKEVFWDRLLNMCNSRREMVVYFLAVLELVKQKIVDIFQSDNFENFLVRYNG
ncbi:MULTISPECIES: segregation and condensation protein A [Calditerrivibrio]|jgi:segregation and condensation protein A|uniref:Segregation and condensation protein A n=1 Tax=Calditerrivibrio nitroreducens TaxID=477976 RepID=A0A2J6WNZ3_9BACT|nr:MAG: segregation/condensation protein A [Calditerrivibrio nitroreducens]